MYRTTITPLIIAVFLILTSSTVLAQQVITTDLVAAAADAGVAIAILLIAMPFLFVFILRFGNLFIRQLEKQQQTMLAGWRDHTKAITDASHEHNLAILIALREIRDTLVLVSDRIDALEREVEHNEKTTD